jgi:hypothetical protein
MKQGSPVHLLAGIREAIAPDPQRVGRQAERRGVFRVAHAAPVHRLDVHAPERPDGDRFAIRTHVVATAIALPARLRWRLLALSIELPNAQILQALLALVQLFGAQQMARPSLQRRRRDLASAAIFFDALMPGVPGRNVVRPVWAISLYPGAMTHRRRSSTLRRSPTSCAIVLLSLCAETVALMGPTRIEAFRPGWRRHRKRCRCLADEAEERALVPVRSGPSGQSGFSQA